MTDSQNEIVLMNERLIRKVEGSLKKIIDSLSNSNFSKTGKALVSYVPRAGYINNAILECYLSNNIYAASILFRPMVEYSFRHLYIHTRALKEDSDNVGEEYYGKLKISEDLESFRKISAYNKKVYPDKTEWYTANPHNDEAQKVGIKFKISSIFFYLIDNLPKDKILEREGVHSYLLERLRQYSNFSSNIHGGPHAERVFEKLSSDKEVLRSQLKCIATESFDLYKNIVQTTYLFAYLMDENLKEVYEEIREE